MVVSLMSCRIDTDHSEIKFNNIIIDGSWEITHFEKFDSVSTQNYSDFIFHFNNNGTINVQNNNTLIEGIWSISDSNPYEDVMRDLRFNLFFYEDPLNDLSNSWDIDFLNNNTLRLVDFSVTSGERIILVLEKI